MKFSKKLMGFMFLFLACLVFCAVAFAADSAAPGIDWKTLFAPALTKIIEGLGTVIGLMVIWFIKLLYKKEEHNFVATKILDFLVGKAIENQLANPGLDNSVLWQKLVDAATKIGIDPKIVKNFEAQIMAQVNAFFIAKNNPNLAPPSGAPLPAPNSGT